MSYELFARPGLDIIQERTIKDRLITGLKKWGYEVNSVYYGAIDPNKPFDHGEHSDNGAWYCSLSVGGDNIKICLGLYDLAAEVAIKTIFGPLAVYFGLHEIRKLKTDLVNILPSIH